MLWLPPPLCTNWGETEDAPTSQSSWEAPANAPASAGANVAVAPKLPSSSSSLLSWSSTVERSNFSRVEYQSHICTEDSRIASHRPIGPWTFYPRALDPRHPRSSGPKSLNPGIGLFRGTGQTDLGLFSNSYLRILTVKLARLGQGAPFIYNFFCQKFGL